MNNADKDMALTYRYLRSVVPDSVYREGERIPEEDEAIPTDLKQLVNGLLQGRLLDSAQREKMVSLVGTPNRPEIRSIEDIRKAYRSGAQRDRDMGRDLSGAEREYRREQVRREGEE